MMKRISKLNVLVLLKMPSSVQSELKDSSPNLNFTFLETDQLPENVPDQVLNKTHILITDHYPPTTKQLQNLKWVQCFRPLSFQDLFDFSSQNTGVIFTSNEGLDSVKTAEKALQQMLALASTQTSHEVDPSSTRKSVFTNTIFGIIGYGSLGRQISRNLQAYRATILASTFNAMNPLSSTYQMPGTGDPKGIFFNRLYPIEATVSMIKQCDYLFLTLPHSPKMDRFASADLILNNMKPTAMVVDCSPEPIIQGDQILKAFNLNQIAGAGIKTINDDNLWQELQHQNLNINFTSNQNYYTEEYFHNFSNLFNLNLSYFLKGKPLINTIQFDLLV